MKNLKKWDFKLPHAYVIIFMLSVVTAILANIIPAGEFERVANEAGRMVAIPGSFSYIESIGCSFFDFFISIQLGFVDSAQIIFFIIFAYAFVYILIKNGTFDAVVGLLLRKVQNKIELVIPVCMLAFGILGSTIGLYEETYGLIPVFIAIATVLGYDAIVGGSIIYIGVAVGFASATINPFTVGVAQQAAEVEMLSGMGYRVICFVVFMSIAIAYVWNYARKVKNNPEKSVLHGVNIEMTKVGTQEELMATKFTKIHIISCIYFVLTIVALLIGTMQLGWYIDEIAALFIIMTVLTAITSGFSGNDIAGFFIEASKEMMYGALLVGLSRTIPIIMDNAQITDTIVNYLVTMLANVTGIFSAIGMLFVQNIINFFIPSGAGQALVTMPILAPVGEMVGVTRQVSVLAYMFGDGFSNIFWPTSVFMMCGIMRLPIDKWYKFITPLFGLLLTAQVVLLSIAVIIGY